MREHVSQSKKATNASFPIPTLTHRIPGFGSDSSQASAQAVPLVQPLNKPLTHDISRISLRRPQAKLSISQPGDIYEQEADSVAQQVMQTISEPVSKQSLQREELQMKSLDSSTLQREEAPEDEEELMLKEINPQNHPVQPIQAKLTIGEPGDKYEQEADRVASQVVQQINTPSAAESTQGKSLQRQDAAEEEIQTKPSISVLQRSPLPTQVQLEAMPEDEELQAKSILQGRDARGAGEASTDVQSAINSARGGGMPLEEGLQRSMGQAMGADFSKVKVHTDGQSDQLNRSIQARAFTTGQDVFFRGGEYNPGSRGGQELLAHELTHVVQQNGGGVQRSACSNASAEADASQTLSLSNKLNQSIQAKAFTTGQDVLFRQGEYNPGSRGGQELIAHELTDVFQQRGEIVQRVASYTTQSLDSDSEDELGRDEFLLTPPTGEAQVENTRESEGGGYVTLWRGTGYDVIKKMVVANSAGGESANPHVEVLDAAQVQQQVQKATGGKIEFTSNKGVAEGFSFKNGGLVVVKIHTKYLAKGSQSEQGWVCDPSAPVQVLETVDRQKTTKQGGRFNAA